MQGISKSIESIFACGTYSLPTILEKIESLSSFTIVYAPITKKNERESNAILTRSCFSTFRKNLKNDPSLELI